MSNIRRANKQKLVSMRNGLNNIQNYGVELMDMFKPKDLDYPELMNIVMNTGEFDKLGHYKTYLIAFVMFNYYLELAREPLDELERMM